MKEIIFSYWKKSIVENKSKILLSITFLLLALAITSSLGDYVDETASVSVPDLILDHIPTVNLDFIFVYGFLAVIIIFIAYPLIFTPTICIMRLVCLAYSYASGQGSRHSRI